MRVLAGVGMGLYGAAFALGILLINPWGGNRWGIWTEPKTLMVGVLAGLNLLLLLIAWRRMRLTRAWWVTTLLWGAFLAVGYLSVRLSPFPERALRGNQEMGDGFVYWLLVASLMISNILVLEALPILRRVQFGGVLAGGFVLALSMFPQLVDWQLDYTATMGETSPLRPRMLRSTIWQAQMPIGLLSHSGHSGVVLAITACLALFGLMRGWLKAFIGWPLYFTVVVALLATSRRGIWIAFAAGVLYLAWRFWRQKKARRVALWAVLPFVLAAALLYGGNTLFELNLRQLPEFRLRPHNVAASINSFSSKRFRLWAHAVDGVRARPLLGWGFNGFGMAWPNTVTWPGSGYGEYLASVRTPTRQVIFPERVVAVQDYTFSYIGADDGRIRRGFLLTNKAHNVILDWAVSVGLVGVALYLALFGYAFYRVATGPFAGLEVAALVFFVFGITWFDAAQFSHHPWWALSLGMGSLALAKPKPEPSTQT